mgnify:CR=1 FL=1
MQPHCIHSGGIGGGTSGTAASQPANFNVVGQSGFNQISQAIQQQGPVQAFVVGSEVTTQQQLDNAIIYNQKRFNDCRVLQCLFPSFSNSLHCPTEKIFVAFKSVIGTRHRNPRVVN